MAGGRRAVAVAVVAIVGAGLWVPAHADPVSHDAWLIEREAMGPQPAQHFDLGASQVAVSGNRQRVRLTAGAGDGWSAEFSAPTGRHLDAGETFVGRFDDLGTEALHRFLLCRRHS